MGEVYKTRDSRLDRLVAIKISAAKFSERFEREARAVGSLNHPNICHLYDVGTNYLVMEFIDGSPLGQVENPRQLLDIAAQVADGLAAAHAAGIVHRDLKPGNILRRREGRVKILDFGLVKTAVYTQHGADASTLMMTITESGTTVGTISYVSPEQARGEPNLTFQSDQFSFGLSRSSPSNPRSDPALMSDRALNRKPKCATTAHLLFACLSGHGETSQVRVTRQNDTEPRINTDKRR